MWILDYVSKVILRYLLLHKIIDAEQWEVPWTEIRGKSVGMGNVN